MSHALPQHHRNTTPVGKTLKDRVRRARVARCCVGYCEDRPNTLVLCVPREAFDGYYSNTITRMFIDRVVDLDNHSALFHYTITEDTPPIWEEHFTHPKEQAPMRDFDYTRAIFLSGLPVRAINVKYHEDGHSTTTFKTFDENIAVGDIVVIPTLGSNDRIPFTCGRVTEVDIEVDFEETRNPISWIVGSAVNMKAHTDLLNRETLIIKKYKASKRKKLQTEFFGAMSDDDAEDLKSITFDDLGTTDTTAD